MKIFVAQLATETNTFAAAPAGLGGFEEYGIFHGDASTNSSKTTSHHVVRQAARWNIAWPDRHNRREFAATSCLDRKRWHGKNQLAEPMKSPSP